MPRSPLAVWEFQPSEIPTAKFGAINKSNSAPTLVKLGKLPLASSGPRDQLTDGSESSVATEGSSTSSVAGNTRSPATAWACADCGSNDRIKADWASVKAEDSNVRRYF